MGFTLRVTTGRWAMLLSTAFVFLGMHASPQGSGAPRSFELTTHRMDVDVDGAPRAYGPPGSDALDDLRNAHSMGRLDAPIVGYLTEDSPPHRPIVQGPHDPAPGYYVSQTAYEDESISNARDPRRYVDATAISYVVLGDKGRHMGARLGDFVAVYSTRTHRSVFGIVGDDGNPSGDEGSLHLLQALGYPFHNGKDDAVEEAEIVIRFYPGSNPQHLFFRTQAALDAAAEAIGLSREFNTQSADGEASR
jgi:Fungal chitosanase of glycosyl hydrolase group 75